MYCFLSTARVWLCRKQKKRTMVEEPKIAPARPENPVGEIPSGEIPVYVTKSNFFRVIHADGIYGGGTPTPGNIMMTFYSHRIPFPEKAVNDGKGNEIVSKRDVKYGIEQEYEVSVVTSLETAKIMLAWLDNTIRNTEAIAQLAHRGSQQK
jgi:hypothetical protein